MWHRQKYNNRRHFRQGWMGLIVESHHFLVFDCRLNEIQEMSGYKVKKDISQMTLCHYFDINISKKAGLLLRLSSWTNNISESMFKAAVGALLANRGWRPSYKMRNLSWSHKIFIYVTGLQIYHERLLTHTITHAVIKSGGWNTAHLIVVRLFFLQKI